MCEVFLSELAAGKLDNLLAYLEEDWSSDVSFEFLNLFEEKLIKFRVFRKAVLPHIYTPIFFVV